MAWVISAVVIWLASRLVFGEDGFGASAMAALVGAIIFGLFGSEGGLFYILALLLWLLALRFFFAIGWFRAVILASLIWFINLIVALFGLPLLLG